MLSPGLIQHDRRIEKIYRRLRLLGCRSPVFDVGAAQNRISPTSLNRSKQVFDSEVLEQTPTSFARPSGSSPVLAELEPDCLPLLSLLRVGCDPPRGDKTGKQVQPSARTCGAR